MAFRNVDKDDRMMKMKQSFKRKRNLSVGVSGGRGRLVVATCSIFIAVAAQAVALGAGPFAERASAAAWPTGYGSGSNYCPQYPQSKNSSYEFDNVYACEGTTTGQPTGATAFDNPGNVYSWQCVELVGRYLWAVFGMTGVNGDGYQIVNSVHNANPSVPVATPRPGSVPNPGDVISLGPYGGTAGASGHTAVVLTSDQSSGSFTIMSENAPKGTAGKQSLKVDLSGGHNGSVMFYGTWTKASWLVLQGASTSEFHIAYQSQSNHLSQIWWANGAWHGPQDFGISAASAPSAATYNHELHYVYRGTNGHLTQVWWANGTWHGPQDFGISATSAPAAATYVNGSTTELHYVYLGTNSDLTQVWWANGAWHGPQDFGVKALNTPGAAAY